MIGYFKYKNKLFAPSTNNVYGFDNRISILENNEYKVTYYEIISGTSGTITKPTNTYFNTGEFGLSGNAILSKIDGSNKPTFETPKTLTGLPVTVSLNTLNGNYITSGVYTDASVAVIYSLDVIAADYQNLDYNYIIDYAEVQTFDNGLTTTSGGRTKLGGTLVENTTISGNYSFNTQWTDSININGFQVDNQHVKLYAYNGTNASTFQIHYNANGISSDGSSNNVYIIDDTIGSKGLTGAGYYGANYTNNSYVQKQWISTNYQPLNANLTSWAAITRAANFDTFVATPSSANLLSLLTDKTGTGVTVFGTSPTFTTQITVAGDYIGNQSTSAIYLGNITPGSTNYALKYTNTDEISINAPVTGRIRGGGTVAATWTSSDFSVNGISGLYILNASADQKISFSRTGGDSWSIQHDTSSFYFYDNTSSAIPLRLFNNGRVLSSPASVTSGAVTNFTFTSSTNTGQTASTNIPNFRVNGSTKTWAAGTIASQYWNYFTANTAAFASASTITNSYGLYVEAATAGTNATITNNWAIGTNGGIKIDAVANTVLANAALATNATNGFLYIPTSAGAPTGVPTSFTGTVAMQYDTTNNKLYIYNGAWKSVTLT